ncbi:FAD/NAD(P)-binding domain-containing protein [Microthyrium microscopicum]|uniref:FAD/NAD(P)-binding domain-containing protein n=1 Tax=Microthyrium microscopicum TaxID=703497 RepID=A0A6A6UFU5_9PEZI|nr:FAD/NAD(P)-binding domain-containing protein [Microthyrium microscopicum]
MDAIVDVARRVLLEPLSFIYLVIQWLLSKLLSPTPPAPGGSLHRPRIAVIGAGLTGVSAASHCIGHGFDTTIFEAGDKSSVGGIWTRVNNTSGLQIHSVMYRFHPSVKWGKGYPSRQEIVKQIQDLWKRYDLDKHTHFDTKVNKVYKNKKGQWVINDESHGTFDGVIAAVGTCGDAQIPHVPGMGNFKGKIYHSSELDGKDAKGKKIAIIGGGASAVEALEFVARSEAEHAYILARSEKWILPRNPIIDGLISMNIYGGETMFSWIPESLLRIFFYRDLKDLAPPPGSSGLFTSTPMVNTEVLDLIRNGKADWLRGDIKHFSEDGILFNKRSSGVPKGGPGKEMQIDADIVIMATGFERPSLSFLPDDCFEEGYEPPNWYMQVFPPQHVDICCNNCTYVNAIGTVGNYHIGIYTRFLLMYLVDPLARPREPLMRLWINMVQFVKSKAPGGAFDFFTYGELMWWFFFTLAINPFRWKWVLFVLFGIAKDLPMKIVKQEDRFRNGAGSDKEE